MSVQTCAIAFEDAEDDRLAISATPPFALHAPRPKDALIHLDDAKEGALSLTGCEDPLPQAAIVRFTVLRFKLQRAV